MISNLTKVWMFLLLSSFSLLIVGYMLGERPGLFIAFLFNVIAIVLIYLYSDRHLLTKLKAKKIVGQDPWGIQSVIAEYSSLLVMPHPHLYIIESNSMSAFSTGLTQERSCIVLTTGLIEKLSFEELCSVIAHEVAHIHRSNTFGFSIISTLANTFTGFTQVIEQKLPLQLRITQWFSPLTWVLIKSYIQHKNYFENDTKASQLTSAQSMAFAMWKISSSNRVMPMGLPPGTSHLFILNPEKNIHTFNNFHPPVEERIKKLIGYYPL